MTSLRNGVLYGHCDENIGANVVKISDPNQRIPVPVVNHATTGSSWWKNSASPMKKRRNASWSRRGSADAIPKTFHRSTPASRKNRSLSRSIGSWVS